MDKVEEFIRRRWGDTDAHWQDGNCYWFALILTQRFPSLLKLYYLPIIGHFIAGDGTNFYDSTGKINPPEKPAIEEELDPLEYGRLLRDCVF